MTDSHPELLSEQRHVDAAYSRLDAMRDAARRVAQGFADVGRGGTHQARLERDAAEELTRRRLAALDIGATPLCFGRLDLEERSATGPRSYHIGRLAVTDDDQVPLVIDWRAPVAEPFYRATAGSPMGVVRRRHLLTRPGNGREIVGLDDEVFDRQAASSEGLTVVGEGALLAALDRARTGRMGDIVATIQAEQDEAIRAPLMGTLVVTGGAGTGKTAVALHRAAYLLYTHRRQLSSQGVLLVGPNVVFLRYIDQVLPSLGEEDVQLATPAGLKARYRVTAEDPPEVAHLKGGLRMVRVVAGALRDREHPLNRDVVLRVDGIFLRLSRSASARIVDRARRRRGTHNEKRPQVVSAVVDHLRAQYRHALGASAPDDPEWEADLRSRLRTAPEVRAALERMWPVLSGARLIHDLFSFPGLIRSASRDLLSAEEQHWLYRPRSSDVRDVAWTEADLALIDEADALLGSPRAARPRRQRSRRRSDDGASRMVSELGVGGFVSGAEVARRYYGDAGPEISDDDESPTFGHVLVDEAQDLSLMQWRMLARRCPTGSMTLVGDFGQASRPAVASGWNEVLSLLPGRVPPRLVALSVNYRTPAEIMELAHRVLAAAAPEVPPTEAVRRTDEHPIFCPVAADDLITVAADAARDAVGRVGTVAVVAPLEFHDTIVEALADVGAVADSVESLDAPVAVLDAARVKGLEFDHVVVVEPAALIPPDRSGLRVLYVILTRATQRLTIVHARPLPEGMTRSHEEEVA